MEALAVGLEAIRQRAKRHYDAGGKSETVDVYAVEDGVKGWRDVNRPGAAGYQQRREGSDRPSGRV